MAGETPLMNLIRLMCKNPEMVPECPWNNLYEVYVGLIQQEAKDDTCGFRTLCRH